MIDEDGTLTAIAAMKRCGNHTWREISDFVGVQKNTCKSRWTRRAHMIKEPGPCPVCTSVGGVFKVNGNYAEASVTTGERITTPEQLLKYLDVDESEWVPLKQGSKKWDLGAKEKVGNLDWVDGRLTGHLTYNGVVVKELWSTWAEFVRRNPIPITPTIRPVVSGQTYKRRKSSSVGGTKTSLVFCDPHWGFEREILDARLYPFHDRGVLDIIAQVAEYIQPERIDILGDWFDFVNMTDKFLRSPKYEYTTQPAIEESHWYLSRLRRACPESEITLIEGNHDARIRKAVLTHLKAVYGLRPATMLDYPPVMSPENLLGLKSLDINWVGKYPDGEVWLNPRLVLVHGDVARAASGATSKALSDMMDVSCVFGHIHRFESAARTVWTMNGPTIVSAYSPGCTCDINGPVPGRRRKQNWQNGFAIIEYDEASFSYQGAIIENGRALCRGRVFEAEDYIEQFEKDIKHFKWR